MLIEDDLDNGIKKLQWLAENGQETGLEAADEALDTVSGAMSYVENL